jgi:glycosyltransferase involved in cell wall biosynthesis
MKIIMSHPTGNTNVRAIISALESVNMLEEFNTTVAVNTGSILLKLLPESASKQLQRRNYDIPNSKLITHPTFEIARMLLPKLGFTSFVQNENSWASIDSVYRNLDKSVSKRLKYLYYREGVSGIYGYEDGALNTFIEAKKHGLACIYDLPIAYWETSRKLLLEESLRLPLWAKTLGGGIQDSDEKLDRKTRELELADIVLCPSDFVRQSLPKWAESKMIVTAHFGSPSMPGELVTPVGQQNARKLRVLFVGSMGQRKGLADLFSAIKLLNNNDIELIVMGSTMVPLAFYESQLSNFTYLPNRPHQEVLELMRTCDVLCLPSIVEGRALVMQEAMSQGLPLIVTSNTGGEDLILEGETGFLVPIRSPHAIAEKLNWFLENRSKIPDMSIAAQRHSSSYSWKNYGLKVVSGLSTLLSQN